VSDNEEAVLVNQIIGVLTPSITQAVRRALAARLQATLAAAQSQAALALAQQQASSSASQTSSSSSSSSSSSQFSQSDDASSAFSASSSVNTDRLVAQIMAALRPSIAISVQEALLLQASSQQQSFDSSSSHGSSSHGSSSHGSSSHGSSSSSSGSHSSGSGSLTSLFGDGNAHNVRVETPQYTIEYNNGK